VTETRTPMNLICPHCQKMVTAPDQNAGQSMNCPFCNQSFALPALKMEPTKPAVLEDVPLDIPLVPLPSAIEPRQAAESKPAPGQAPDPYKGVITRPAPDPPNPPPPPPPPKREERITAAPPPPVGQPAPEPAPSVKPVPPPAPAGYSHTRSFHL